MDGQNKSPLIKKPGGQSAMPAVNVGGALVIVIFVVLCLTIFGFLSFVTAYADKKLADKSTANITQYYQADSEAEAMLARIYQTLKGLRDTDAAAAGRALNQAGVSGAEVKDAAPDGWVTVSYGVTVNELQTLFCDVAFYRDARTGGLEYKVLKWQAVVTGELNYDGGNLDLWDGEIYGN